MSKVGQRRLELEERPEYQAGYDDAAAGLYRPEGYKGPALQAYLIGIQDLRSEYDIEPNDPDLEDKLP